MGGEVPARPIEGRRRARRIAAAFLACAGLAAPGAGCRRDVNVELPSDPRARSMIVAVETGRALKLIAVAQDFRSRSFIDFDTDTRLTALLYPQSLEELQIAPGPIEVQPQGRALPPADRTLQATIHQGTLGRWEPLDAPDPALEALRIAALDPKRCVDRFGCGPTAGRCNATCAVPETPLAPAPPRPPSAVTMEPCPASWAKRSFTGATLCEPPGALVCGANEAQFLGDRSCGPVGPECPSDGWPRDLPSDRRTWFVRAGAPGGGDGSRARPFRTIADAVATAAAGEIIALATGAFRETILLPGGITLVGACSAETVISGSGPQFVATGLGARVENVRIEHSVSVVRDASLHLENVVIDTDSVAVATQGSLSGENVVIRNADYALDLVGGHASISRLVIDQSGVAALLGLSSTATLSDTRILRPKRSLRPIIYGEGVGLVIRRASIETLEDPALVVRAGSTKLEDTVIVGPAATSIQVFDTAKLYIERGQFSGGFDQIGDQTTGRLENVVVRGLAGGGAGCVGASVFGGAHLEIRGMLIDGAETGVLALGSGTSLFAADLTIQNVRRGSHEPGALAIQNAFARVERARFQDFDGFGLALHAATATVADVSIASGRPAEPGGLISPAVSLSSSRLDATRIQLEGQAVAVDFQGTGAISLTDATIRRGDVNLHCVGGCEAIIMRTLIEDPVSIGIALPRSNLLSQGTNTITASDLVVRTKDSAESHAAGIVASGGRFHLSSFLIEGMRRAGIEIDAVESAELRLGVLRNNRVAIDDFNSSLDLGALTQGILFEHNEQAIEIHF